MERVERVRVDRRFRESWPRAPCPAVGSTAVLAADAPGNRRGQHDEEHECGEPNEAIFDGGLPDLVVEQEVMSGGVGAKAQPEPRVFRYEFDNGWPPIQTRLHTRVMFHSREQALNGADEAVDERSCNDDSSDRRRHQGHPLAPGYADEHDDPEDGEAQHG